MFNTSINLSDLIALAMRVYRVTNNDSLAYDVFIQGCNANYYSVAENEQLLFDQIALG